MAHAQSSMMVKVWRRGIGSRHVTGSGGRACQSSVEELGGSLLSPFYSICPTPDCELMPPTHIRVFLSQ